MIVGCYIALPSHKLAATQGTLGYVLRKFSDTQYRVEWYEFAGMDSNGVPQYFAHRTEELARPLREFHRFRTFDEAERFQMEIKSA